MNATDQKYTVNQIDMARLAKAMAHPARVAILELLIAKQRCICGDIVDELPLSQATISQHLKALKSAGIITGEVEGVRTCYCIDQKTWHLTAELFNSFLKQYRVSDNCC